MAPAQTFRPRSDAWREDACRPTCSDGFLFLGRDGVVEHCDADAERLFGYEPGTLGMASMFALLASEDRSILRGWLRRLADPVGSGPAEVGGRLLGLRRDGRRFPLEVRIGRVMRKRRALFATTVWDPRTGHRRGGDIAPLGEGVLDRTAGRRPDEAAPADPALGPPPDWALDQFRRSIRQMVRQAQRAAGPARRSVRGNLGSPRGDTEEEPLEGLVAGVLGVLAAELDQARIQVTTSIGPNLPALCIGATPIEQVLFNVLYASLDAVPPGVPLARRVHIRATEQDQGHAVLLTIYDNGVLTCPQCPWGPWLTSPSASDDDRDTDFSSVRRLIEDRGGLLWATSDADREGGVHLVLPVRRRR